MQRPDRAYLFFGLCVVITAALVFAGKADVSVFLGVLGLSASCLGFYQAQPPPPKSGPGAPGPAAGLLLPFLVLSVLACEGGELRLHLVAPRSQAAPITASSLQLYRQVAPSCPAGLTCLSATAAGTLVQTSGSTSSTLATLPLNLSPADLPQTITAGSCTTCSLSWNGAGQLTVATSGSGGGGGAFFSPVKLYASGIDPLGNYTVGCKYVVVTDSITVSGVRFRRYGTAATITAKLWRGGSELASASVAVTPPGVVEVSFTSAVTLSAGDIFWTTIYDGGTRYARAQALAWEPGDWSGAGFFTAHASGVYLLHPGQYGGGDKQPDTGSSGERFPVEGIMP